MNKEQKKLIKKIIDLANQIYRKQKDNCWFVLEEKSKNKKDEDLTIQDQSKLEKEILEAIAIEMSPFTGRVMEPQTLKEMNLRANRVVMQVLNCNNYDPPPDGLEAATVIKDGVGKAIVIYHPWVVRLARPQDFKEQK